MYNTYKRFLKYFCSLDTGDRICQVVILITGPSQAWLLTRQDLTLAYYGCIIGLVGSPFWLYTSIKNKQFGIIIIAIWYAGCYTSGLWR